MKRARGFTMIELGMAIAVISVLIAGGAVAVQGFVRAAKTERASKELSTLLEGATVHVTRDLSFRSGCTGATCVSAEPLKRFAGVELSTGASVCFDLGCATAPCAWNGQASGAQPRTAELLRLFGGGASDVKPGHNPFDKPYGVCVWKRRVQAFTCLPEDDVPQELGGGLPDACPGSPLDFRCAAKERCVGVSATLSTPTLTKLGMRQKYLYWGEATQP